MTLRTLTVAQLIERLQDQDPDAKVIFSTCYGDYSRTMQALPIKGDFEETFIQKSAYSNSGFATVAEEDRENQDEEQSYLVIS